MPPTLLSDPHHPESFEGERILVEVEGVNGLVLWQVYRDALLWAAAPAAERRKLFRRGTPRLRGELLRAASLDALLLASLRQMAVALRHEVVLAPAAAENALAVAGWAERAGFRSTAVAYARLAAALRPSAPEIALNVGTVAQRLARPMVAETWFHRTVALSRRAHEWATYAAATLGLAELAVAAGRFEEAARQYLGARRVARRIGVHEVSTVATRGLLRLALVAGDSGRAAALARSALRRRGSGTGGAVHIDVAELHLRLGRYRSARRSLHLLAGAAAGIDDRVRIATMLVRACGGLDDRRELQNAWLIATALIDALGDADDSARKMLDLAYASAEVLEEAHADECARRALERARRAGNMALVQDCNAFLARPRFFTHGRERHDAA